MMTQTGPAWNSNAQAQEQWKQHQTEACCQLHTQRYTQFHSYPKDNKKFDHSC